MINLRQEQILFKKAIARVNLFLKFVGIYFNHDDPARSLFQRLRHRWYYCMNLFCLNTDGIAWMTIVHQLSVQEITFMVPCILFSILGIFKSYSFLIYHHHVIDIIMSLENLQSITETSDEVEGEMKKKRVPFLYWMNNILFMAGLTAIAMFFIGPALTITQHYLATNEIQLTLPFTLWYPFDPYDIKFWPFAIFHQLWAAWLAVFCVYGPDIFFYTVCMFIHVQFRSLCLDMTQVARRLQEEGRQGLASLVKRHLELIRCINLLEIIYGKSTLFNALSSSLIICLVGFNIMAIDDIMLMAPFAPFLVLGSLQIFLFCYYGDMLMEDSLDVSDSVYNSEWYELSASDRKYCLFILMRAQKPCKITAYGFSDMNMRTFARILSTSWSYFTLLKTMNEKQLDSEGSVP